MNTTSLEKQYKALKPWERIPMILAAEARADKSDLQKLISSAPTQSLRCNDYYLEMKAMFETVWIHHCHQLELVAKLYKALWLQAETEGISKKADALARKAILKLRREIAWEQVAWMSACKELNVEPDSILAPLRNISIMQEELSLSMKLFIDETKNTGNEERDAYIEETAEAYKNLLMRNQRSG